MRSINMSSLLAVLIILAGCAAPATRPSAERGGSEPASQPAPTQSRALTIAVRYEVNELGANTVGRRPSPAVKRLFNGGLSMIDGKGQLQPYLAAAVPRLNTDTWRVSPDGRMETVYTLKPNL